MGLFIEAKVCNSSRVIPRVYYSRAVGLTLSTCSNGDFANALTNALARRIVKRLRWAYS